MPRRNPPASQQVIDAEFRPANGPAPIPAPWRQWDQNIVYPQGGQGLVYPQGALRGFGDDGPVTNAQQLSFTDQVLLKAQLYQAIVALRTAIGLAQAQVAGTPSSTLAAIAYAFNPILAQFLPGSAPAETKTAVANALTTMSTLTDMRESEVPSVMDGSLAPDRWFAAAQAIHDGVASILSELQANDTLALLEQSWADTKRMLEQLKIPFAIGGSVVVAVVLALAGFVAYQYLTAPLRLLPARAKSVSGYKPSRRRKARKPRRVKAYVLR